MQKIRKMEAIMRREISRIREIIDGRINRNSVKTINIITIDLFKKVEDSKSETGKVLQNSLY